MTEFELPLEADPADVAEQREEVLAEPDPAAEPIDVATIEADSADLAEQAQQVSLDPEDYTRDDRP